MFRVCFDYDGSLVIDWLCGNMDMNIANDSEAFVTEVLAPSDPRDDTETFIYFTGVTVNDTEGVRSCLTGRTAIAVTQ